MQVDTNLIGHDMVSVPSLSEPISIFVYQQTIYLKLSPLKFCIDHCFIITQVQPIITSYISVSLE
jgi:hypothetical protein